MKRTLILLALFGLISTASQAAVIYDNGGSIPGDNAHESTAWITADDFSLAGGGSIASASIYAVALAEPVSAAWDGGFEYWLFADSAGVPGSVLASGEGQNVNLADTGIFMPAATANVFRFDFDLESPFVAAPGTTYWLGIHLSVDYVRDDIYWVFDNGGNGQDSPGGSLVDWDANNGTLAFTLSDTPIGVSDVPEPATLSLLGASLLSLMWVRRKRS